jgi:hypothetical protein
MSIDTKRRKRRTTPTTITTTAPTAHARKEVKSNGGG